jgi:hypothetical protein
MKRFLLSRAYGTGVASFLVKTSLGLFVALACMSAKADFAFVQGTDFIVFSEKHTCPAQLVDIARQRGAPADMPFRAAKAMVGGVEYNACWTDLGSAVGVIYEDGDVGTMDKRELRKLRES